MKRSPLLVGWLAALALTLTGPAEPARAGGGGGSQGAGTSPTGHELSGQPAASPTPAEASMGAVAGQIAAQVTEDPRDAEEVRRRKRLEIFRLASEIAQLAAEFGN